MKKCIFQCSSTLSILVFASLTIGCGASKNGKESSESRGTANPPTQIRNKMAECNNVNAQRVAVEGHISTYYEPTTGKIRFDFINMSLQTIPREAAAQDTYSVQFLRWAEDTAGTRQLNSIPTRFMVIDRLNGSQLVTGTADRINKALVDAVISKLGSTTTVTADNFVQRAHFVLTGVDFNYDGIAIALVDRNNVKIASVDVLLPPFYADPNIYIQNIKIPALQALHPFYNLRTSGGSENDFYQMAESICSEMISDSSRVPASTPTATSESQGIFQRLWSWVTALFQ